MFINTSIAGRKIEERIQNGFTIICDSYTCVEGVWREDGTYVMEKVINGKVKHTYISKEKPNVIELVHKWCPSVVTDNLKGELFKGYNTFNLSLMSSVRKQRKWLNTRKGYLRVVK